MCIKNSRMASYSVNCRYKGCVTVLHMPGQKVKPPDFESYVDINSIHIHFKFISIRSLKALTGGISLQQKCRKEDLAV